MFTPVI